MRHHITIGKTDTGKIVIICDDADPAAHRECLQKLTEKGGKDTQRLRYVEAWTLTTDHAHAFRRFPIRDELIDATPGKPAQTEPPAPPPSAPAATSDEPAPEATPVVETSTRKGARK